MLQNLFLYFRSYTCVKELILVFRILYLYYRTYSCISDLILVLQSIFLHFGSYSCISDLILVLRILYLDYGAYTCLTDLYLYYGAYTCTKVPVVTTQIHYTEVPVGTTGLILILQNLYLFYRYGSTRRYYRIDAEVPVGTFRTLPDSFLYSYSLLKVLSYNCLSTQINRNK